MACCPTAPSHYLNLSWFTIYEVLWHSLQGNFCLNTQCIHVYKSTMCVWNPHISNHRHIAQRTMSLTMAILYLLTGPRNLYLILEIILGMVSVNERRRCIVTSRLTPHLIGLTHAQNYPCLFCVLSFLFFHSGKLGSNRTHCATPLSNALE